MKHVIYQKPTAVTMKNKSFNCPTYESHSKFPHHHTNSSLLDDHKNPQKSPKQMTGSKKWHVNDNNELWH